MPILSIVLTSVVVFLNDDFVAEKSTNCTLIGATLLNGNGSDNARFALSIIVVPLMPLPLNTLIVLCETATLNVVVFPLYVTVIVLVPAVSVPLNEYAVIVSVDASEYVAVTTRSFLRSLRESVS